MSYQEALTHLASWQVAGVAQHYGVDTLPERLTRAQLPALLVLPLELEAERRLFQERGEGFVASAFSGGMKRATLTPTHLLLLAPQASGVGLRAHLPTLVTVIDAYLAKLAADAMLGGTLALPAQVRVETGVYTLDGAAYVGCAFRHTWTLRVGGAP